MTDADGDAAAAEDVDVDVDEDGVEDQAPPLGESAPVETTAEPVETASG